jgi:hypothetical protein
LIGGVLQCRTIVLSLSLLVLLVLRMLSRLLVLMVLGELMVVQQQHHMQQPTWQTQRDSHVGHASVSCEGSGEKNARRNHWPPPLLLTPFTPHKHMLPTPFPL